MASQGEQALLLSQETLRRIIGWLGLAFPVILVVGAWSFQISVSDYYYTNMRDFFVGVLFFLGLFLIAYRPYGSDGWQDNVITSIAGVFALIVAFFPVSNVTFGHVPTVLTLQFIPAAWSVHVHNVGSGGLFLCFAVISALYFTKGDKTQQSDRKKIRNLIYVVSGLGIIVCLVYVGWGSFTAPTQTALETFNIFWPEAIALVLFGFSWLVKGATFPFLNDN
jgi:hypothetical protein